ncbi:MAG: hypothetical protein QW721_02485 [Desulfurococcaceae archaeon]
MPGVPIDVVKLQARNLKPSGTQYVVTVPSALVRELRWTKGDTLVAKVVELEVDGRKRKVLVYYKAE